MKRFIIVGLVAFLAIMLLTFPARVAYKWFVPSEVKLAGISGSIWSGAASEGVAGGAYLRDVKWRFRPSALLRGQVGFTASANPGSGTMQSIVTVGLDGTLTLSELNGSVPLDLVHQAFQQSGIRGDVFLQFETLAVKNGLPIAAEGSVTLADFYAPALSAEQIGDFQADFHTTDSGIAGTVQDLEGVLDVAGTIELLPDRSYRFIGEVAPTPETPPSIRNQLQFLGSPDARGQRPFRFEGQL